MKDNQGTSRNAKNSSNVKRSSNNKGNEWVKEKYEAIDGVVCLCVRVC